MQELERMGYKTGKTGKAIGFQSIAKGEGTVSKAFWNRTDTTVAAKAGAKPS